MHRSKTPYTMLPLCLCLAAAAHETYELDSHTVEGRRSLLVGEAISASQGLIGQIDLETRPMLRTGEILESIPGLIVTQHSGSGKANQYFLRGFNLDHGTDFATWIDGMPVNMVSHGHGQGYTDINFVIPELIDNISYLKGPYYSEVGDFSSAGSASISTVDSLDQGQVSLTVGENQYLRAFAGASWATDAGDILFGFEGASNNGPWDLDEDLEKLNGLMKYSDTLENGDQYSVTFMGYSSTWNSADQIPQRAVQQGLITPFGSIDDTVGGDSSRYSLSGEWIRDGGDSYTTVSAYSIYYDMNLWSNFTYLLDDPVNGDQFQQSDRRMIYGGSIVRTLENRNLFNKEIQHTFGFQTRFDNIDKVGLYNTVARERIGTNREDSINELSAAVFYDASLSLSETLKANFGARLDYYDFDVNSDLAANSGTADDVQFSPKLNLAYSPTESTEYYVSAGYGFHSNDARGTTITVDPSDGTAIDKVDPLVKSLGYEIGVRHYWTEHSNTSVSFWGLELDSELLYVGDAGNTEASRPSDRYGVEIANYLALNHSISMDLDIAFTDSSYADFAPEGDEIPGSIDAVCSLGLNFNPPDQPWFGSARYRYFSDRPLIEDGSVKSGDFNSVNFKFGYKFDQWQFSLDLLNAFDSEDDDITYYYASRLPGEPAEGVEDIHFHIIEPRTFRLNISRLF